MGSRLGQILKADVYDESMNRWSDYGNWVNAIADNLNSYPCLQIKVKLNECNNNKYKTRIHKTNTNRFLSQ